MADSLAGNDGVSFTDEFLMVEGTDWVMETLKPFMTNSLAVDDGVSFTEEFLMIEGTDRFSEGATLSMSCFTIDLIGRQSPFSTISRTIFPRVISES